MTFFCDTPGGRIAQAEETLGDLERLRDAETHERPRLHLERAIDGLVDALELIRAYDIQQRHRRGEQS